MLFQKASELSGFKSLTEYVIVTIQRHSERVVAKSGQILSSKRDATVFFNALMDPPEPNDALKAAHSFYRKKFG